MEGCGALNVEHQIPGLEAAASELSAAVAPCSTIENRGILALMWTEAQKSVNSEVMLERCPHLLTRVMREWLT